MSDDTPTFTASFKTGGHYGASLLVVRGETVEELETRVVEVRDSLVEAITETENLLSAAYSLSQPEKPAPAQASSAASAPVGEVRTCEHGKRTRREGTSAKGAWVGFFCPLAKGDPSQCKPIFENK